MPYFGTEPECHQSEIETGTVSASPGDIPQKASPDRRWNGVTRQALEWSHQTGAGMESPRKQDGGEDEEDREKN